MLSAVSVKRVINIVSSWVVKKVKIFEEGEPCFEYQFVRYIF